MSASFAFRRVRTPTLLMLTKKKFTFIYILKENYILQKLLCFVNYVIRRKIMLLPTITRDRLCVLQCQSVSELTSSLECNPLSRNVKKKKSPFIFFF